MSFTIPKIVHGIDSRFFRTFVMGIFLLFSFLGHYFVYFSLTRYFDPSNRENIALIVILGILSISFTASSVLAHSYDNRRTRYLYFLSALWIGVGFYLVLSFLTIWLLALLFEPIGSYFSLPFLGGVGIVMSVLISIYGFYNASRIQITRITVPICGLPSSWNGKKIVHISDVHLGHILRSRFLRRIVRKINAENPEVVCITGDLFDGMDGRLEHLIDGINDITAPHGILYVDGNHESYLGIERAFSLVEKTKTQILRDSIMTIEGLDFIGLEYPAIGEHRNLPEAIRQIPGFDTEKPSILLYHTPEQVPQIAKTGVNLELCGHTHRGQMWPLGYVTWLTFGGRDYGLSTIGDYALYTSSGVGTWGPPMRVASKSEIVVIELIEK